MQQVIFFWDSNAEMMRLNIRHNFLMETSPQVAICTLIIYLRESIYRQLIFNSFMFSWGFLFLSKNQEFTSLFSVHASPLLFLQRFPFFCMCLTVMLQPKRCSVCWFYQKNVVAGKESKRGDPSVVTDKSPFHLLMIQTNCDGFTFSYISCKFLM